MLNCLSLALFQAASTPTPMPSSQLGDFSSFLWLAIGIVLGVVIGVLMTIAFRKPQSGSYKDSPSVVNSKPEAAKPPSLRQTEQSVRRCPACKSTYTDRTLQFCLNDGARLENIGDIGSSFDPEETRLSARTRGGDQPPPPTVPYFSDPTKDKQ